MPKRGEIGREREKKFYSRIPFMLDPGKKFQKKMAKNLKKLKKTSFRHYFLPKRDEIGREREKKKKIWSRIQFILGPSKRIPKKIAKKFKKIKKPPFSIIFSQNGMR